jgi:predicted HicB family RNase H-like nuclease
MSQMHWKGYWARVEFDAADRLFVGHIAGINDIVGFHADNVTDLDKAFREAVEDYLETCARVGKKPDKAYSGKMMLRVSADTHANAALAAEVTGKSLNQWSEDVLSLEAARTLGREKADV